MSVTYADFLAGKRRVTVDSGIEVDPDLIHPSLFPFQRAITTWALRKGRAAIFADTGLGKTRMQVEWARLAGERTLILAPLAVAAQTVAEAARIGVTVTYAHHQGEAPETGITISNYERLHRFDPAAFGAVILDESSILKSFSGTTKKALIAAFADTPYRLACTATPAPNDLEELCNHAHFLGVMKPSEMRSTFFIADNRGQFMKYRIKKHARTAFYRWLASWAMAVKKPSDLGFDDDGFDLPGLDITPRFVQVDWRPADRLFALELRGVTETAQVRRATLDARVTAAASIVHSEDAWYYCGNEQGGISASVEREEPRAREGIPGSNKGPAERQTPRALRHGRKSARPVPSSGNGLGTSEPEPEKGTAATPLRSDAGAVPGDDGPAAGQVCNLRDVGHERPERVPGGGSLPRNGDGAGTPVPQLQPSPREDEGRPRPASEGSRVPERWVIWCGLNDEQDALERVFGKDCISVYGSLTQEEKVGRINRWLAGERPILLSKTSVCGFGMNFQSCARMIFVGLGYSYEQYYQALRRCHRYGQTRVVEAHIVLSEPERPILDLVLVKERQAAELSGGLISEVASHEKAELFQGTSAGDDYEPRRALTIPEWMMP